MKKKMSHGEALERAEKQIEWALCHEVDVPGMLFRMYHQLLDDGIDPDLLISERHMIDNLKHLVQKRDNYRAAIRNLSATP